MTFVVLQLNFSVTDGNCSHVGCECGKGLFKAQPGRLYCLLRDLRITRQRGETSVNGKLLGNGTEVNKMKDRNGNWF